MRYTRLFEDVDSSAPLPGVTGGRGDGENGSSPPPLSLDRSTFVELLSKHKALLLQSDDINSRPLTVNDFGDIVTSLDLAKYPYVGGAAPRRTVPVRAGDDVVYTANESPPHMKIPFHHELAQIPDPPAYLFFYCDRPSDTGGETALIDSTVVYRYVAEEHPEFMDRLKEFGVRYVRTMPGEDDLASPLGRSYYNCYQVETKEELVEKLDGIDGLEYEWTNDEDDSLKVTSEPIPAVRFVEQQGRHAVYQWTFHNSVIAAFVGWDDKRNDPKNAVRFGNDEPMDHAVLSDIASFMDSNKLSYTWKKGDIFALNNRLVMHSRNHFTGARRVYAAMAGEAAVRHETGPTNGGKKGTSAAPSSAVDVSDPLTFGFWRLDDPEEVAYRAVKNGYRRLDSACDYGNEVMTGRGIRRAIEEGICRREDLFITSKLWNTYHDPKHVPLAMDRTLKDLQLDYVDEYLIHFPISMEYVPFDEKYPPEWSNLDGKMKVVPNDINATWRAMEGLVDAGKTRSIGLSNFNCQHIRQILSVARIKPTTLQIECHPHHNQSKLIRFAREVADMRVSVFSPLGGTSYISLDMATKDDVLFTHPVISNLAKKHSKTPAQIMLRWAVQRDTLPISKSSSGGRMVENRGLFDFYLHGQDVAAIDGLNLNRRYNDPGVFCERAFGTFCPIYE